MNKPETTERIIEKDGRRYREVPRKSALPIWAAALVWVIAALLFPLYSLLHLILAAAVSAAAALVVKKIVPKETMLVELPFYEGNNDLNHVAGEIADARDALRAVHAKIAPKNAETAAVLNDIEVLCGKIQAAVLASPDDLPKIRRFLNYYLPVTRKLADKYVLVTAQETDGANIAETTTSIEQALDTIRTAYQHQLDALFSDDALDISTDITVLETMMARDNLR